MFPRMLLMVLVIYPPLLYMVGIPLGAMLVAGVAIVFVLQWRLAAHHSGADDQEFTPSHPLKLSTAIKFGLIFTVVLIIVEFAQGAFGTVGVYATSVLAGITDVDAITLSVTQLAEGNQLKLQVAGTAVLIAYFSGSPELRHTVVRAFGIIVIVGIMSSAIAILVL